MAIKAEGKETVKLSPSVLEVYREWSKSTGRTLSGLLEHVLSDAAIHYREGINAGLDRASNILSHSETIGGKRRE